MKIWVHINGVQEGPYDVSELPLDRMTAETPVWYEGLEYWMPAGNTELTARYFNNPEPQRVQYQQVNAAPQPQQRAYAAQTQPAPETEARPANYLVWSVLLTIICCNPIGIIPIITGCMVGTKYRNYDYQGAKRSSETTAWWLMITIVTSLIYACFSPLMVL